MSLRPRPTTVLAVAVFAAFCAAPTPGDVGGCGQAPQDLDPPVFFATKKAIDCERCTECGLASDRCEEACDETADIERSFPVGCFPLVHDGEVCLRALLQAPCSDYRSFIDDEAPQTPSECNFCPPRTP